MADRGPQRHGPKNQNPGSRNKLQEIGPEWDSTIQSSCGVGKSNCATNCANRKSLNQKKKC